VLSFFAIRSYNYIKKKNSEYKEVKIDLYQTSNAEINSSLPLVDDVKEKELEELRPEARVLYTALLKFKDNEDLHFYALAKNINTILG
jgi:hypothetical protein